MPKVAQLVRFEFWVGGGHFRSQAEGGRRVCPKPRSGDNVDIQSPHRPPSAWTPCCDLGTLQAKHSPTSLLWGLKGPLVPSCGAGDGECSLRVEGTPGTHLADTGSQRPLLPRGGP